MLKLTLETAEGSPFLEITLWGILQWQEWKRLGHAFLEFHKRSSYLKISQQEPLWNQTNWNKKKKKTSTSWSMSFSWRQTDYTLLHIEMTPPPPHPLSTPLCLPLHHQNTQVVHVRPLSWKSIKCGLGFTQVRGECVWKWEGDWCVFTHSDAETAVLFRHKTLNLLRPKNCSTDSLNLCPGKKIIMYHELSVSLHLYG